MEMTPFADAASAALKVAHLKPTDGVDAAVWLERNRLQDAEVKRDRLDALKAAERTHAYRKEAAQLLGRSDSDLTVLLRMGLLGTPLSGFNRRQMIDRRAIHALIAYRDAIAGER
jgi:hypothetical protein